MNVNDDLDTANGKLSAQEAYCARQRLAQDQAALFPTRLAMARWRGGGLPHLHGGHPPLRAAWYARAMRNHQAWLDRGGFAQHDELAPLRKPVMWQAPQAGVPQPGLQVFQQNKQHHTQHHTQQHSQQHSQQNSQPPCGSDRDGDARQCGTCT